MDIDCSIHYLSPSLVLIILDRHYYLPSYLPTQFIISQDFVSLYSLLLYTSLCLPPSYTYLFFALFIYFIYSFCFFCFFLTNEWGHIGWIFSLLALTFLYSWPWFLSSFHLTWSEYASQGLGVSCPFVVWRYDSDDSDGSLYSYWVDRHVGFTHLVE